MAAFPHLRAAIVSEPWAIMPGRLEAIAEVVERRLEGYRLSAEEIATIKGSRVPNGVAVMHAMDVHDDMVAAAAGGGAPAKPQGAIAVINMMGIIAQHASQVDDISGPGGTSTERVGSALAGALADPSVMAIVLNIDSPGGNVYGVQELADQIYGSRGQKPIVAQVNSLAASAAYWIACAADEIVVTPSGEVGSVGVYALHQDVSKAADMEGVKFTFISAGKYKVEGNRFAPLDDEAAQAMQSRVDATYGTFVKSIAKGRGIGVADVRDGFGQGRVVGAADAVSMGMADRVATMNQTLKRLGAGRTQPGRAKAEADAPHLEAAIEAAPQLSTAPTKPDAAEPADLAANDDLRRRRHAHRLRRL